MCDEKSVKLFTVSHAGVIEVKRKEYNLRIKRSIRPNLGSRFGVVNDMYVEMGDTLKQEVAIPGVRYL